MSKEVDIVVLAGGRGQRMKELSETKPKSLLEAEGKPILSHIFDNLITAFGSANVVVALGYRGNDIKEFYGNEYGPVAISYVYDPRPLETRQRLLLAKDHLPAPFLFLAGDVLCHPNHLQRVVELQEHEFTLGTISGSITHEPAVTHAVITVEHHKVISLKYPPPSHWTNDQLREMGVACFTPNFIRLLEIPPPDVYHISTVIASAVSEGRNFRVATYKNCWYHFIAPQDLHCQIIYEDYKN